MPVLRDTAQLVHESQPDIEFIIPIARTIAIEKIKAYFAQSNISVTYVTDDAITCMSAADFVVVASGTASLECALLEKPMCIIYKGSLLTYIAAMQLIKVRFLGLCNLLANKMIVPEFLQYDCNPIELSKYITRFFSNAPLQQYIIGELTALKTSLSSSRSDCSLLDLIETEMPEINAYVELEKLDNQ